MDSFYMYPGSQFAGSPMPQPLAYPTPGSIQPSVSDHQQLTMMQYAHGVFPGKASPAPAASHNFSSRIPGDHESAIYSHDRVNGGFMEQAVRQMITADGNVFIEHIPGYSIVYVPSHGPIEQVLGDMCATARSGAPAQAAKTQQGGQAGRAPRDRNYHPKPSNAFIMYRNHMIKEMRQRDPDINQIEISRKAGDMWKAESEEVKEQFRKKYREEKQAYDQQKSSGKRPRADSSLPDDDLPPSYSDVDSTTPVKRRKNDSPSLGLGVGSSHATKPRSRTMPSAMFNSSAARQNIFSDLRKQVAARSGAAFLDSSPFDSQQMHQAYAEMASSASIDGSPIPSIMGSAPYLHGDVPALNLAGVQGLPAPPMTMAEHESIYASHQVAMTGGVDPAALAPADQSDLTNSFVNAGIAAGITMMPADGQQVMPMGSEASEIAAAASIATSSVLAGGFYSDEAQPQPLPADQASMQSADHSSGEQPQQWPGDAAAAAAAEDTVSAPAEVPAPQ
ncbi:hypothetical protein H4R18_004323 [Coemansia javaensis]|uniref:HMG box domain-containing protein n=1 Tax=Coemansia javaensis TaxID=2761396 RepID=A0A9W8LH26_9FUNG|nr:hypothetical protein H4R18_004323 [Coemansia javaensis]